MINIPGYQSPTGDYEKDFAHELPDGLLNLGWRKFWSKRENREYYYNKNTGASLWDLEELNAVISSGIKRKICDSDTNEAITPKKNSFIERRVHPIVGPAFVPGSLYNFSQPPSPSLLLGHRPTISVFLPPHPLIELERAGLLAKLRCQFTNCCTIREGIEPPDGSFNRWLLQMKIHDNGTDPLLPSRCTAEVGVSMKRELMLSLPFPLVKPKFLNVAKSQLIRYTESVKNLVEKRNATLSLRKIIKCNIDETLRWIRNEDYRSFDDYVEKLASLKRVCQPHIQELVRESVEKICVKMYHLSRDYAGQIRVKHLKLLQQCGVSVPPLLLPQQQPAVDHIVVSPFPDLLQLQEDNPLWPSQQQKQQNQHLPPHPIGFACPCPLFASPATQPLVEILEDLQPTDTGNVLVSVEISSMGRFQLTKPHFEKLEHLYLLHTKEDPGKIAFGTRLWCLLQRYYSYLGCESGSVVGAINQAALPVPVFEALNRLFDVSFELFASPMNCYFRRYCSAFHDTDQYFGSCGPALEFFPISGSFEANPPFCEELLLGLVRHVEKLLEFSSLPLSFIIFIPDWRDPPFEALTLLEASPFKRNQITLRAREHEYRIANFPPQNGGNHGNPMTPQPSSIHSPRSATKQSPEAEILKRSIHNTLIVFLQNDAGFQKWMPTSDRLKELVAIYNTSTLTSGIPNRRDFDEEYVNSVT